MSKPTYVSTASMDAIIEECYRIHQNHSVGDYIGYVRRKRGAIPMYPGN